MIDSHYTTHRWDETTSVYIFIFLYSTDRRFWTDYRVFSHWQVCDLCVVLRERICPEMVFLWPLATFLPLQLSLTHSSWLQQGTVQKPAYCRESRSPSGSEEENSREDILTVAPFQQCLNMTPSHLEGYPGCPEPCRESAVGTLRGEKKMHMEFWHVNLTSGRDIWS